MTVCRVERISDNANPAGSTPTSIDSLTGLGNPGISTGGVIREASGTGVGVVCVSVADRRVGKRGARDVSRCDHKGEAEGRLAVLDTPAGKQASAPR